MGQQNYWYKKYCFTTPIRHSYHPLKTWWEAWFQVGSKMNLIGYSEISLADVRRQAREWADAQEKGVDAQTFT